MTVKSILIGATTLGLAGGLLSALPGWLEHSRTADAARAKIEQSAHFAGCREARRSGVTPLHAGEPGYSHDMDGDGDGIACEDY